MGDINNGPITSYQLIQNYQTLKVYNFIIIDNLCKVACGDVLRDESGRWLIGYVRHLRPSTTYVVELYLTVRVWL